MKKQVIVTTSWDDGHKLDLRLAKLLKKYNIKGTFYISPNNREFKKQDLLSDKEIIELSKDFEIGAHTMTHPRLTEVSEKQAQKEIIDSKSYLENLTKKKIISFCYPGGDYNDEIKDFIKKVGFTFARTIKRYNFKYPTDQLAFGTTLHAYNHISDMPKILRFSKYNPKKFYKNLDWEYLAKRMFDYTLERGGIYHLWGHSWEIEKHRDWEKLERVLDYIGKRKNIKYASNGEICSEPINKLKNSKLKLLVVTPYFYPKLGGMENYAYNISKGLNQKYNWSIVVVTSNHEDKTYKEETIEGMKIYRLPRQFKVSNTPISFKWKKQISKIIEKEKPDVINAHSPVPFISDVACRIAHKRGIPFVLTYHAATMYKENNLIRNLIIWLYELFLGKKTKKISNKITTVSDFARLQFPMKIQDKTEIVYNSISEKEIINQKIKTKKEYDLIFLGSLDKAHALKGLEEIIKAIKIFKDEFNQKIKLAIVGDGDNKSGYQDLVNELSLQKNILFLGSKFGEEKNKFLLKSNALITYPTGPYDAFPTVFLEAWAKGLPIIASDIGAIPYLIKHKEDGFLVKPNNPKKLAEGIHELLRDKKLQDKLIKNGHDKVTNNFIWEIQAKKMDKILREILEK